MTRSKNDFRGSVAGFKHNPNFWKPSNLRGGNNPYSQTRSIAEKLGPLNSYQKKLLREASSRPWDYQLQAMTQAALQNVDDDIFKRPPPLTEHAMRDVSILKNEWVLFVPQPYPKPAAFKELLENRFTYSGSCDSTEVYISDKLTGTHTLIVGQSGTGKTVKGQISFLSAQRSKGRWAFLSSKAEEWHPVLTELIGQGVNPAMPREMKINPLAPIGNALKSLEHFVHLFCSTENIPPHSRVVFEEAVDLVYRKFVDSKPLPLKVNPTFADLRAELKSMENKESKIVIRTLDTKIRGWERQFGNWVVPWDIEELSRRTILFPLSQWSEPNKRKIIESLQGPLFRIRESKIKKDITLILYEEGRLVLCAKSQMAKDFERTRAEGMPTITIVQSTRELAPEVLENTGIKALGPVGHPAIARQMAEAMGLTKEHLERLYHLPVGHFIERYMYGYAHPLMTRAPYKEFRHPTEEEIKQAAHALDDIPTKSWEEANRIDLIVQEKMDLECKEQLDDETSEFLMGIHENPYLKLVERFEFHGLNARKGNEIKNWCVERELLDEKRVALGLGGSSLLLQLTTKAQNLLDLPEINQQVVHSYAMYRIEEHCQAFGAEVTLEDNDVDVLVKKDGRSYAIEVEITGTKALNNLEKNTHHDQIIFVAVGNTAKKKLIRKLTPQIKSLGLTEKVYMVTLGQVVKSAGPIWEISLESV